MWQQKGKLHDACFSDVHSLRRAFWHVGVLAWLWTDAHALIHCFCLSSIDSSKPCIRSVRSSAECTSKVSCYKLKRTPQACSTHSRTFTWVCVHLVLCGKTLHTPAWFYRLVEFSSVLSLYFMLFHVPLLAIYAVAYDILLCTLRRSWKHSIGLYTLSILVGASASSLCVLSCVWFDWNIL